MVLGELDVAITALAAVDLDAVDDIALHASLVETQRQLTRLQAVQASQASAWSARKAWADDGSKSAGARLSRDSGVNPVAAGMA